MVIWSSYRMRYYRDDHRKDATHFISEIAWINTYQDMIPEMEMIASSSPEDFYRLLEHVQMRIHHYNQQNSQRQIE